MMRISFSLTRFVFLCGVLWGLSTQAQTKDPAAILQLDTTTQGLLPPRMTTAQRDAIDSPPDGLMIFNTTTGSINFYTTENGWIGIAGASPKIIHNGLAYYETTSVGTGEIWLDRDVGAHFVPGHIGIMGNGAYFTFDEAQTCCPPGYRLPTKAEFDAEIATFATNGGNNHICAWNVLKLVRGGQKSGGIQTYVDRAHYRTSTEASGGSFSYYTHFDSSKAVMGIGSKTFEMNVRCIKDD